MVIDFEESAGNDCSRMIGNGKLSIALCIEGVGDRVFDTHEHEEMNLLDDIYQNPVV